MVADHGGTIVYERSAGDAEAAAFAGKGAMPPLYEYTWNHTTLHALKVEPDITYLQVRFPERGEARPGRLRWSRRSATSCSISNSSAASADLRLGPAVAALSLIGAAR